MNELQPNGRAADIFSLGCVFLEILVLNTHGTLHQIRDTRPNKSCFHANLNKIGLWLEHPQLSICPQASWLRNEVRRMMAREPGQRPDIKTILKKAAASELVRNNAAVDTIFGACCKTELMSRDSHEIAVATLHEAHFEQCQEYDQRLEAKDIERIEASKRSAMMLVELERRLHRAQKTIVILKSESANAQGGRRAASQGSSSDDNRSAHTTFDDHETPEEQCPEQEYQDRDGSMHRPLAKGPFDR